VSRTEIEKVSTEVTNTIGELKEAAELNKYEELKEKLENFINA